MAIASKKSADYLAAIQNLVKPTYESKYNNVIDNTLQKILNKESFSYDPYGDTLFQNYKDQYTKLGKEGAMNAAAAASTLTGGYGNSYAATAASQANQQYLTQLTDKIPELYNAALNKYQMEQEDLYNQFGVLQNEENRLYGQHRDTMSDYYSDLSDLRSGHNTAQAHEEWEEQMEYQKQRDAIADAQWERNFNFNSSRANVSDSQWQQEFNTKNSQWQQEFDTKNSQWQKEYELALKKARSGGSGGGSKSSAVNNTTTTVKQGTADTATNSGKINNSRSATLSVTTSNNMLDTMLKFDSDSKAQSYLMNLVDDGRITAGDYNYLADLYEKLVAQGTTSMRAVK